MSEIKQQDTAKELTDQQTIAKKPWSWQKKFGFRVLFIFFLAMSIPFSANWYKNVFTLDWSRPHYRDLYDISRFQPSFLSLFGGQRSRDITDSPSGDESVKKNGSKKNKTENGAVKKSEAKIDNSAVLPPKRSFLADYTDWGIALLFSLVGALIWTAIDRKSKSYHILYYWIRVVVRYRAGIV
jgi:hypothetical protein